MPCDPDTGVAQPRRVEERRVVVQAAQPAVGRGGVPRIGARQHPQHHRGVAHRPRHRAGGVLGVGDGNDPCPADQPHRRLDADDAVGRRRADDGAVGLGADGHRREVGRHRRPRARARAARVPVEDVGVAALAAPPAPPARRPGRPEVGPFAEVGLAEQHRPRLPQPGRHRGVLGRDPAGQGQRARRRGHAVGGVDVVLDQHRDPVQGAAQPALAPLAIEPIGDGEGVGIGLEHGPQRRPAPVDLADAGQIGLHDAARRPFAAGQAFLQLRDGRLRQREVVRRRRGLLTRGSGNRHPLGTRRFGHRERAGDPRRAKKVPPGQTGPVIRGARRWFGESGVVTHLRTRILVRPRAREPERCQRYRACPDPAPVELAANNPMGYFRDSMQTVAETPTFTRQSDGIFSEDEKRTLIDFLARNPLAGAEIRGTGGVRKLRFAASGRGKRGGARVIYYYFDQRCPSTPCLPTRRRERRI